MSLVVAFSRQIALSCWIFAGRENRRRYMGEASRRLGAGERMDGGVRPFPRPTEGLVEPFTQPLVEAREEMPVAIQRRRDRGVSEPRLYLTVGAYLAG